MGFYTQMIVKLSQNFEKYQETHSMKPKKSLAVEDKLCYL